MGKQGHYDIELKDRVIFVRRDGKTLTVKTATADEEKGEDADFVVHLDDIEHWDAPHEGIAIGLEELRTILVHIETELDQNGHSIDFS
ncbi:MAG: Imm74 family immunity protein [Methylocystis sp.]|nr:Imm74 family immunity protein [Methylocystis sp.]